MSSTNYPVISSSKRTPDPDYNPPTISSEGLHPPALLLPQELVPEYTHLMTSNTYQPIDKVGGREPDASSAGPGSVAYETHTHKRNIMVWANTAGHRRHQNERLETYTQ